MIQEDGTSRLKHERNLRLARFRKMKRFEMSDNLHYLSATDALAKFASGELSPVTLMQAIINRAHAVEPTTSVASVAADWDPSQSIHIKGKAVHGPFAPVLMPYFNAPGRLPVVNVPTGRDQNNVP